MNPKLSGFLIILISIIIGALRLMDVIDNNTTAVLGVGAIIIFGGAAAARINRMAAKSGKRKPKDED